MKLTCTLSRLLNGKWLARHTGSSTGQVEVTAPTREEALTKMRDEHHVALPFADWTDAKEPDESDAAQVVVPGHADLAYEQEV